MKKILALLLALCMVFALCACGGQSDDAEPAEDSAAEPAGEPADEAEEPAGEADDGSITVGLVCVHDENSGYDLAHIEGLRTAAANVGIPSENVLFKYNVGEDETCYDAIVDLIEQGCDIVFTDSYGHQDFGYSAAVDYPDVVVVSMTGDYAGTTGLNNYKNAFCHTYESRYVSGVVAGMKLQEMIDTGELTDANYDADGNIKLGYVGAYPYAEVVSGYTAFFLGVRSIVENVTMDVRYTNSWYDPSAEATVADSLMADGCCIISQHADSTGAPSAVQAAHDSGSDVYCVGYNISMLSVAPTAALTSASNDWSVFYTYALQCMVDGEEIPTDWSEGYAEGANYITELGASCAAGTDEKVAEVEAAIAGGSLDVFETSKFTCQPATDGSYQVDADGHVTSAFGLDTDGDWINDDGEAIENGVFRESVLRSAPYFALRIDGITEISE